MDNLKSSTYQSESIFQKKVWIVIGIVALVLIILWVLKTTFSVLLLVFAGALIALYFRGLSNLLQKRLSVPSKAALPISIIITFLLVILFFWFAGNKIQQQVAQLTEILPATLETLKGELSKSSLGRQLLEKINSGNNLSRTSSVIQSFFKSTFGVLGDIYIVLILSIFFTASPRIYTSGFVRLLPIKARPKAEAVLNTVGTTLTKWLKGQLFAMLVVTVLTLIGLLIIGVPMAFVLALIAGILNFIPNFGPLLAMIPAILVSLLQGSSTTLFVIGLYLLVQTVESNIITPQIQKKMISMPPAIIIMAQLFMGVLTGGWGLVLATPFVAMLIVLVQELWVKRIENKLE